MRALVVAPQPFFSPRGTPFSVYFRSLVTAELGVKIDFLTYGEGENVEIPEMRIIRIPRFSFLGNVKTGPSLLKFFLDIFLVIWTAGLLIRNKYDFVHAHEEAVFFCRFLKPIFRFKLVYDMHSSLPQQLTNFQYTKSRFLMGVFKKLEDSSLKSSDAIITICTDLTDYVLVLNIDKDKVFQIENSIFDAIKVTSAKKNPGNNVRNPETAENGFRIPRDRTIIVYAGTLEHYQGIDILIAAFKNVVHRNPDAFLLIVGGTPTQVEHYQAITNTYGLAENVLFTGRVSQSLAKYYSNLASVLVSPRKSGTNTPLKIYEQIASGIPLVATDIYSHTQVLDTRTAFLVKPEPEDMARGILEALDHNGNRQFVVENAMKLYERRYSRAVYQEKMKNLLKLLS
jgi:glycosyltransferase involved in cell wall biosynthesis